ncbi:DUF934 domain-containing protein [Halioxenophilus aromaticivorans]|uniref:DUF934 domain-containing protein n=1 Tax=Halioxenophilus aromaticivorans TaxID=1306992 RepID=A0AAV3UAL7_9ALTE
MPKLIKDEQIIDNAWLRLDDLAAEDTLPEGDVIVPLSYWVQNKAQLQGRVQSVGVSINNTDDVTVLAEDAQDLPLVEVYFPAFMDGRGFSQGRLLRERFGFTGELRAAGAIIRDQLCYLRRCGFNAFRFDDESMDLTACLSSLYDFTDGYQPSVDQPAPLFARRG